MSLFHLGASPLGEIAYSASHPTVENPHIPEALTGLYFVDRHVIGRKARQALKFASDGALIPEVIRLAQIEVAEYFAGKRKIFSVPVAFDGTVFQHAVWTALHDIPWGEAVSYGDLARRLGLSVGNARAIGSANARNPISIIVPCHRVIGSSGSLTGYAGGLDRKHALLALESVRYSAQQAFDFDAPAPFAIRY